MMNNFSVSTPNQKKLNETNKADDAEKAENSPPPEIKKTIGFNIQKKPIKFEQMKIRVQAPIIKKQQFISINKKTHKKEPKKITANKYIFPAYIDLGNKKSPHLLAHEIIYSDKAVEDVINDALPEHHQEIQMAYPSMNSKKTLGQVNHFFFDLFHISKGLNDYQFTTFISSLFHYKNNDMTKTRCQVNCQTLVSNNPNSHFLVPRLLSYFNVNANEEKKKENKSTIFKSNEPSVSSEMIQIGNFFAKQVSEFVDKRDPPPYIEVLPKYSEIHLPGNEAPHFTKSYIYLNSPIQDTAFAAFLFNSEYISVSTGAEGENGGNSKEDDYREYKENLDNYFISTANISLMQTIASALMRAYSLLICNPKPSFNRFPGYLIYTLTLIYQKSTRTILDIMSKNYDAVIGDIAQTILTSIHKINGGTPQWDYYLTARNAIYSSKHILKYNFQGTKNANEILNNLDTNHNTYIFQCSKEEKQVIGFLKAYLEEVYPLSPHKAFFNLVESINDELLIFRPFAAAILMIPTFISLFKELDIEFKTRMNDDLFLHGVDRQILKISEKIASPQRTTYENFIVSDAPFSMKMFLDYAIILRTAKKEIFPQKLTFTNISGFKLMMELDSFSSIITAFLISYDFKALKNLYVNQKDHLQINYVQSAAEILQGRDIISISKTPLGYYLFRKIIPHQYPQISTSFTYLFDPSGLELHMALSNSRSNETISQSISDADAIPENNDPDPESNPYSNEDEEIPSNPPPPTSN